MDRGELVEGDAYFAVACGDNYEWQDILKNEGDYGVGVLDVVRQPHLVADLVEMYKKMN